MSDSLISSATVYTVCIRVRSGGGCVEIARHAGDGSVRLQVTGNPPTTSVWSRRESEGRCGAQPS